jgi:ATP/maltotriose-dependent transcriptional regulator MalT
VFADWLRNRLFHTQPDSLPALHRRASDWHAQSSMPEEAIRHALAAGDPARAARLMAGAAPAFLQRGESGIVLNWLAALLRFFFLRVFCFFCFFGWAAFPYSAGRTTASLCLLHARALRAAGHVQAAGQRLADARAAPDCGPAERAEIDRLRSDENLPCAS